MKKNARQKTAWQRQPLTIKAVIIGGAFTIIAACLTIIGTFVFEIFKENFAEPTPNAYLHKVETVHYRVNYFPSLPCIEGKIWAVPEESELYAPIRQGTVINYQAYNEFHKTFHSVAPTISYLNLSVDLPSTEQAQLEDISLEFSYKPNVSKVLFLILGNNCAGGALGPVEGFSYENIIEFGQRVISTNPSVSLTVFDKNKIQPQTYIISNSQQPMSIVINALEPGWYEIKVVATYVYHGKERKVASDETVKMYVPEPGNIPPVYLIPFMDANIVQINEDEGVASAIIDYQQHSVYMTDEQDDQPLCVYNSETTPPNNLESRAEEKKRCLRTQMVM